MTTGSPVRPEVTLAGPVPENPEGLCRASHPLLGPGNLHVDQRGPFAPGTPGPEKHRSPTWRQVFGGLTLSVMGQDSRVRVQPATSAL